MKCNNDDLETDSPTDIGYKKDELRLNGRRAVLSSKIGWPVIA